MKISKRNWGFKYAVRGIMTMLGTQHNEWLHAMTTVIVIALGFFFGLTRIEWCFIILAISAIWAAEALNSAFEALADVVQPEYDPRVKKAKDIAAGAVLIAIICSVIVAILIMGPHVLALWRP